MRPDEHKRKKNTQYKKKHGMNTDKAGKEASAEKSGEATATATGTGSKKQSQLQASSRSQVDHQVPGEKRDGVFFGKAHSEGSNRADFPSGEEKEGAAQSGGSTHFQRRQVASNWSRYEGLDVPQEEADGAGGSTLRGADFAQVLSVSSTSSSQFRFQDEKYWQEETHNLSAGGLGEVSDLLAIDCNQLSTALDCVPLHRRLDIEESAFQPHHIELFNKEAQAKRDLYMNNEQRLESVRDISSSDTHTSNVVQNNNKDVNSVATNDTANKTTRIVEKVTGSLDPKPGALTTPEDSSDFLLDEILGASEVPDLKKDSTTVSSSEQIIKAKSVAIISDLTNEKCSRPKDANSVMKLEDSDTTAEDKTKKEKVKQISDRSTQKPAAEFNIEDQLDALLSVDEEDNPEQSTNVKSGEAAAKGTDELESWLDDMLGD